MKPVNCFAALICGTAIAAALAFTGSGCATKKFVRRTVSPIEQKLSQLERNTSEHASSIEELDKGVSRADERALSADQRASAASQEATRAREQAALAGKSADEARSVADRGLTRAGEVGQTLGARIDRLDNYQLVSTESVQFGSGRSDPNAEAKEALDGIAQKVASLKRYVIEVRGFTDPTGPREHNLELSRKRAAAVVRYLTINQKIPLHRIHLMGCGSDSPVADNSTREGRRQNRRVEIRTLAAIPSDGEIASAGRASGP